MKPHILWGFIWIQIVCIGHQRSSTFTASRLRDRQNHSFQTRVSGLEEQIQRIYKILHFLFTNKNYCVIIHSNRLNETVRMHDQTIGLDEEIYSWFIIYFENAYLKLESCNLRQQECNTERFLKSNNGIVNNGNGTKTQLTFAKTLCDTEQHS